VQYGLKHCRSLLPSVAAIPNLLQTYMTADYYTVAVYIKEVEVELEV
jgi:hypothetical protein